MTLAVCSSTTLITSDYDKSIRIWINVYQNSTPLTYFGINSFVLAPSFKLVFNNQFALVDSSVNIPLPFAAINSVGSILAPTTTPYEEYMPMLIYGLEFPYNFHQYNYTTKTFVDKKVVGWVIKLL